MGMQTYIFRYLGFFRDKSPNGMPMVYGIQCIYSLKMDGWKTIRLPFWDLTYFFQWGKLAVSFREC